MSLDILPANTAQFIRTNKIRGFHLGCNTLLPNNWINIDFLHYQPQGIFYRAPTASDKTRVLLNWDLTKGLPADPNTLDYVYHSHLLEHLNYRDGLKLLSEIYSALKVGGRQRIVVPDLERYCKGYLNYHDKFLDQFRESESGIQSDIFETRGSIFMSQFYEQDHKMGWDFETLFIALKKLGFRNIKRTRWRESDFPDLNKLESGEPFRIAESLYAECEK
jgi:predicted SAM-dependent methyltransferase